MLVDANALPVLPLTREQDQRVEEQVAKQLGSLLTDTVEFHQEIPGLRDMTGEELLVYLEAQDMAWWFNLNASHPNETRQLLREFASLARKYRGG